MYAWTGKILRLNMTAKTATIEDNKYCKDYLGGQGLANRIIYEEVPAGTHPQDEASKMVHRRGHRSPEPGAAAPGAPASR